MRRSFLLPFPTLALIMGLAYVFGDPRRTTSPSFAAARSIAPLSEWGYLFLAGAVVLFLALAYQHVGTISVALFAGGIIYTWWAGLFLATAINDPHASLTAWAIHGTIAFWHYVTAWRIRIPG